MSVRINIIVEGEAEELFVSRVLGQHFGLRGMEVRASRVVTRLRAGAPDRKGGTPHYRRVHGHIARWLKQDRRAYVTTMFDLYALHPEFPDFEKAARTQGCYERVQMLEAALENDVKDISYQRFVPYIQLHEFEALLFSDLDVLDESMVREGRASRRDGLDAILRECGSPEEINEGENTAPSKRIISLYPGYRKVLMGTQIADQIGIGVMRDQCPHFDSWLTRLESLDPLE